MGFETDSQAACRTPNWHNQKRTFLQHIIVKLPEIQNKERILHYVKEKHQITYTDKPIRRTTDFSTGALNGQEGLGWSFLSPFKKITDNSYYRICKAIFQNQRQIKTFYYKDKLQKLMTTKPALQNTWEILNRDKKDTNHRARGRINFAGRVWSKVTGDRHDAGEAAGEKRNLALLLVGM